MRLMPVLAVAATALLLAGCPKKPTTVPGPSDAGTVTGDTGRTGAVGGAGVGDARGLPGDATRGQPGAGPAGVEHVIYFDFDRSDIRPEFAATINAHGRHLAANPGARIRLEGHTDERGSREYNIALGERRSQAVRRALMLQGAADAQLTTVSYGEERPAVEGSDESAYAQNRRVEIVYGR